MLEHLGDGPLPSGLGGSESRASGAAYRFLEPARSRTEHCDRIPIAEQVQDGGNVFADFGGR